MQFDLETGGYVCVGMLLLLALVYATCWTEYCGNRPRDVYLLGGVGLAGLVAGLMVFFI